MTDSELGRWVDNDGAWDVLREQRDQLAALRAENASLREALTCIVGHQTYEDWRTAVELAERALASHPKSPEGGK